MKTKTYTVGGVKVVSPKTLPNEFAVKVHSQEHYEAVVHKLYDMGFSYGSQTAEEFCEEDTFEEAGVEYVICRGSEVTIVSRETNQSSRCAFNTFTLLTLDELYPLKSYYKKVVLTHEYTALVKEDHVQVGCQQIPFEKVEELYQAIKDR